MPCCNTDKTDKLVLLKVNQAPCLTKDPAPHCQHHPNLYQRKSHDKCGQREGRRRRKGYLVLIDLTPGLEWKCQSAQVS
jgi:hypothetical protein